MPSYLSEPIWIRERQIRERALPLDKVPRRPNVVVPRDDPFYWVSDHVKVDRLRNVKPFGVEKAF